jgi:hypothetical protein
MPNAHGKSIDKTYLSIDNAETRGFIHRDYIAHCLRWTHVCKHLARSQRYKTAKIIDVGCGRELPLAKTLYSSRYIPERYVGVEYGPIEAEAISTLSKTDKFPGEYYTDTDVCTFEHNGEFNIVTCFEVFEHVEPAHGVRLLKKLRALLDDSEDATIFLSTPCYDEKTGAADNHVNETTYEALGSIIESVGLEIKQAYGTFASIKDYKDLLAADGLDTIFAKFREYYDTNYLATIFAPLYPAQSRNCLWVLGKDKSLTAGFNTRFKPLANIPKPWSQSPNQDDFLGELNN